MGTRSHIATQMTDGRWGMIYVHWDGAPHYRGPILLDHYTNVGKVRGLIKLGAVSTLAPSITKAEGHTFDEPVKGHTVFYKRDRGEKNMAARYFANLEDALEEAVEEYVYVFRDGAWSWAAIPAEGLPVLAPLVRLPEWDPADPMPVFVPNATDLNPNLGMF